MTALTNDKNVARRDGSQFAHPVAASVTIYAGAMVAVNASGHAVPAGHNSAASSILGVAQRRIDAQTTAADASVTLERGVFLFENDANGATAVTAARLGAAVYAIDDQTISFSNAANSRKYVGKALALDNDGTAVWVIIL